MPTLPFDYITILADSAILVFVAYYFFRFNKIEKKLEEKENKSDIEYHKVVDDAFAKERKIIEDATGEAQHIIQDTKYITSSSKEDVDEALAKMIQDIHKDTLETARQFMENYKSSLSQISMRSQADFQEVAKGLAEGLRGEVEAFANSTRQLELDLQKQVKDFHDNLLPNIEKELDEYKKVRMKQTEQTITSIVQKASQEILNRSISLDDHEALIIESLEKAKREGAFD
ncbi:MAG TPA: hypothetical protein VLG67_01125 [Candidatus Saccharimonadales bacterium]|nr:hypothetical protein [Candidatus Saccharimonadales bacterium]